MHLEIVSGFDYRGPDAFQGSCEIFLTKMNASFELNLVTNYDEVTGDYYPYMNMNKFALDVDVNNVEVNVQGGTEKSHYAV